ncbi:MULTISPECIES: hypothetical protein [Pirellulaceae]|uniref:hypothetical protein n=1 Tax=Pirellulaceae TaxID=2691357 RepID=UPI0011AFD4C6|nr:MULTISPECIES: hypothetical protein [Pirellulaceae]
MNQQDNNPFKSPATPTASFERETPSGTVFPYAVGLVLLGNFGLCILAPGLGIVFGGLISVPGLFNGYASLNRKTRYESVDRDEQWYCIFLGFAQLMPIGLLAGIAMMFVGTLVVTWIDLASTDDTAIDEAIGGFFSGSLAALVVYFSCLVGMIRWKARN